MRQLALVLALLCLPASLPARADVAAPRRQTPGQLDPGATRRTGRLPARISVTPSGAAAAPAHVIVTIPRAALNGVLSGPRAGAQVLPLDQPADPPPANRVRHIAAGVLLALAVLSLPLIAGRRRGGVAAVVLVVLAAGTVLLRADIAAPRNSNAQTVEVVIVPGSWPIQVQLSYPRP